MQVRLLPVESTLFTGDFVCAGTFVCGPEHPHFRSFGPATSSCVVFPNRSVRIRHRDDEAFVADRTVATLYNRGDEYERAAVDPAGDDCYWFAIDDEILAELTGRHGDLDRPFAAHRVWCDGRTYLAKQHLILRLARGAIGPVEAEEEALHLLGDLFRTREHDPARPARSRPMVEAVREILARRFAESMTLREIAAAVGASPFHVCRTFRSMTGTTLVKYREQLRLRAALERIAGGRADDDRLVDLALDLGYSSHSHFTASFTKTFGVTPSAFRARVTSNT